MESTEEMFIYKIPVQMAVKVLTVCTSHKLPIQTIRMWNLDLTE